MAARFVVKWALAGDLADLLRSEWERGEKVKPWPDEVLTLHRQMKGLPRPPTSRPPVSWWPS